MQWTEVTERPVRMTKTSPTESFQLPVALGPLRAALQAPQYWPAALAALLSMPQGPSGNERGSDAGEEESAGDVTDMLSEAGGLCSPPLSLSPCASLDSFSRGNFTTVSGPCTPPGAFSCGFA